MTPTFPQGLKFDGRQELGGKTLLWFTEMDEESPSYGGSFTVDEAAAIASTFAIVLKRAEVRARFERKAA